MESGFFFCTFHTQFPPLLMKLEMPGGGVKCQLLGQRSTSAADFRNLGGGLNRCMIKRELLELAQKGFSDWAVSPPLNSQAQSPAL